MSVFFGSFLFLSSFFLSAAPVGASAILVKSVWGDFFFHSSEDPSTPLLVQGPFAVESFELWDENGRRLQGDSLEKFTFVFPIANWEPRFARGSLFCFLKTQEGRRSLTLRLDFLDPKHAPLPLQSDPEAKNAKAVLVDENYPELTRVLLQESRNLIAQKNFSAAAHVLKQARQIAPKHREVQKLSREVEEVVLRQKENAEIQQAQSLDEQKKYAAALKILEPLREKYPDSEKIQRLYGEILRKWNAQKQKRITELLQQAERAEQKGDRLSAQKDYEEVLALDAQNLQAQEGLSRLAQASLNDDWWKKWQNAYEQGDIAAAERLLQKPPVSWSAAQKNEAQRMLAELKERSKEGEAARADQVYTLALESYRRGNYRETKRFLEETLRIAPQHSRAKLALQRLLENHPELREEE